MIESRYVYRGNAVGAAAFYTRIDPKDNLDIVVPARASVSLPVIGGKAEAKSRSSEEVFKTSRKVKLFSLGSAQSTAESDRSRKKPPFLTTVRTVVKSFQVLDSIFVEFQELQLESVQDAAGQPHIHFGATSIVGVRLGRFPIKVNLDLRTLNERDTFDKLCEDYRNDGGLRQRIHKRCHAAPNDPDLPKHKGIIVTSIVESIEGRLPPGAVIEDSGYSIKWPDVGRIIFGEVLITEYSRRATLVRVELGSPIGGSAMSAEGEVNGSGMP